jgi:subtilisin-like proprotein convertase family protein
VGVLCSVGYFCFIRGRTMRSKNGPLERRSILLAVAAALFGSVVLATQLHGPSVNAQKMEAVQTSVPKNVIRARAPEASFCNSGPITIPVSGATTPYPSGITVSGLTGVVQQVRVMVTGLSHTFSGDVSMLLVSPSGQKVILMAQAGGLDDGSGVVGVTNANLTFTDRAAGHLPPDTGIASGTYRPTNYIGAEISTVTFPAPAPAATTASPYFSTLYSLRNTEPNGTWNLYVVDSFQFLDGGSISGGWCLELATGPAVVPQPFTLFQGSIAGNEPTQVNRLERSGLTSQTDTPTVCPGPVAPSQGTIFYDQYAFTNNNTVPVPVTVTTTTGCGRDVFVSAYFPAYTPAVSLCTNYLADSGSASSGSAGPAMSFTMTPGQTVVLVANQSTTGTLCADYSILVEGFTNTNAPTAAGVTVSGRVLGSGGRGLVNAIVRLTDAHGVTRSVTTEVGGTYVFADVEAGQTYTMQVSSRLYQFTPRVVQVVDSLSDLDFTPE